jgi:hypothetical protein
MLVERNGNTKFAVWCSPSELELLRTAGATFKAGEIEIMRREPRTRWMHATVAADSKLARVLSRTNPEWRHVHDLC